MEGRIKELDETLKSAVVIDENREKTLKSGVGDTIVLEEYNPKTKKYTGRTLRKRVRNATKLQLLDFNDIKDIKKYGHWIIELEQ